MTDADIAHAKARANDCINGFMQVRMQQARDVVKLAEALQAANRKIEASKQTLHGENRSGPDNFDSIFSDLMKGKKP